VLDHREFLGIVGLNIFVVIVLGTIRVMTITSAHTEGALMELVSQKHILSARKKEL
jgi:hypothetical protein